MSHVLDYSSTWFVELLHICFINNNNYGIFGPVSHIFKIYNSAILSKCNSLMSTDNLKHSQSKIPHLNQLCNFSDVKATHCVYEFLLY